MNSRIRNRRTSTRKYVAVLASLLLVAAACGGGSEPESAEPAPGSDQPDPGTPPETGGEAPADGFEYPAGTTINYMMPTSPGGGAAALAAVLTEHFETYLPGNPTFNQEFLPGGGGQIALNEFMFRREHGDGTEVLQAFASATFAKFALDDPTIGWDPRDMIPVQGNTVGGVLSARTDTVTSVEDLLDPAQPLVAGEFSLIGRATAWFLVFEFLDLDITVVSGYEGTGPKFVAFEQGETNLDAQTTGGYGTNTAAMVEAGDAIPLLTLGQLDGGEIVRDPDFPDVATAAEAHEILYGEPASGPAFEAYKNLVALLDINNTVFLHADTPPEIIAAWEEAAVQIRDNHHDDVFERSGGYRPVAAEQLEGLHAAMTPDPEIRDYLISFLEENYDFSF